MSFDILPGESDVNFEAFTIYRDMGPARSLKKVSDKLGKSTALIGRWATKYHWVDRTREWDDNLDEKRRQATEKEVEKMAARHARIAICMQDVAQAKLSEYKKRLKGGDNLDEIRPKEVATYSDLGIKIERLIRGEPTERIDFPRIKVELVSSDGTEDLDKED